jgi:hypothetical protein
MTQKDLEENVSVLVNILRDHTATMITLAAIISSIPKKSKIDLKLVRRKINSECLIGDGIGGKELDPELQKKCFKQAKRILKK